VALLYALLLVIAAGYDFLRRRIPNWTVLGLLLVFTATAVMGLTPTGWASSLAAFGIALACSGSLYLLGWIGAGDAKLFSAAALFAGLPNLLLLAIGTALAGGVYALAVLFIRPKQVMRAMTARGRTDGKLRGIPYGVAIAAGALMTGYATHFVTLDGQPKSSGAQPHPAAAGGGRAAKPARSVLAVGP
jgi:prepilin peptidase CpaA